MGETPKNGGSQKKKGQEERGEKDSSLHGLEKPREPGTEVRRRRTPSSSDETLGDNISGLNPFPPWSVHTQPCVVIVVQTNTYFLGPLSKNSLYWASWT